MSEETEEPAVEPPEEIPLVAEETVAEEAVQDDPTPTDEVKEETPVEDIPDQGATGEGVGEAPLEVIEEENEIVEEEKEEDCQLCSKYFAPLKNECLFMHAHEPWPKDVKLFQPYAVEQILLPDNANSLAVQAFLKMCNLEFQVEPRSNAESMSPSGKVPFIKCGAFLISELEPIAQFVDTKGISLSGDLDKDKKDDMRAYMSLIRNVLENAELYVCWCDTETYNTVTKPRNGSIYPFPLNYFKTWGKRSSEIKKLKLLGWYDKSLEDVYKEVENCCQALTDRLEGNEYFFGNKYTEIDALLYGHLASILVNPVPPGNQLALTVHNFTKLVEYAKKIDSQVMGLENDFDAVTMQTDESATSEEVDKPVEGEETTGEEAAATEENQAEEPAAAEETNVESSEETKAVEETDAVAADTNEEANLTGSSIIVVKNASVETKDQN